MNNKPVAWMLADKEAEHIRSIMSVQHDFVPEGCVEIPLYTHPADTIPYKDLHQVVKNVLAHPVKELTDEEIKELAHQHRWNGDVEFARAILLKAQK